MGVKSGQSRVPFIASKAQSISIDCAAPRVARDLDARSLKPERTPCVSPVLILHLFPLLEQPLSNTNGIIRRKGHRRHQDRVRARGLTWVPFAWTHQNSRIVGYTGSGVSSVRSFMPWIIPGHSPLVVHQRHPWGGSRCSGFWWLLMHRKGFRVRVLPRERPAHRPGRQSRLQLLFRVRWNTIRAEDPQGTQRPWKVRDQCCSNYLQTHPFDRYSHIIIIRDTKRSDKSDGTDGVSERSLGGWWPSNDRVFIVTTHWDLPPVLSGMDALDLETSLSQSNCLLRYLDKNGPNLKQYRSGLGVPSADGAYLSPKEIIYQILSVQTSETATKLSKVPIEGHSSNPNSEIFGGVPSVVIPPDSSVSSVDKMPRCLP